MSDEIIRMLNEDLKGEHAAIVRYLVHAYAMGEGELACEIEAIAREEMRHFGWLAETIVGLGGVPSIERASIGNAGEAVSEWMSNAVLLEVDAISTYEAHIRAIDDRKIRRLLERILSDERAHRGAFEHFVDKAKKEGAQDRRGARRDRVTEILDWGIEHEYTVVLQYLLHSYLTGSGEAKKELQDQAVNEMQHLGWLSEEMVDAGGAPRIEHTDVDRSEGTADMLRADIRIEREVAAEYDRVAGEVDDPGLKKLLIRIRDHEIYHADVFADLLKQEEGQA